MAGVVSPGALAKGDTQVRSSLFQPCLYLVDVHMRALEEVSERQTFFGDLGVERKSNPPDLEVISFSQLINTHGTEVTPRSAKVREYFQNCKVFHRQTHGGTSSLL